MKEKIMQEIKAKNIRMRPCYYFCAKKIGLQSSLALFVVAGALLLNIILYLLKRAKIMSLLFSDGSDLGLLLISLPYDYIALFLISILLANYIMHQFDLSCGVSMNSSMVLAFLLVMVGFLSLFFFLNGIEDMVSFWAKNDIL